MYYLGYKSDLTAVRPYNVNLLQYYCDIKMICRGKKTVYTGIEIVYRYVYDFDKKAGQLFLIEYKHRGGIGVWKESRTSLNSKGLV